VAESVARVLAVRAIGAWPGDTRAARKVAMANGCALGSYSHRHASEVWREALAVVYAGARAMGSDAGRAAPLAMVAALASHLGGCSRCWRTGPYGSDTPVAWLMWACARNESMAALIEPVMVELAGVRLDRSVHRLRVPAGS
jgi:hypothetical protein